MLARTLKDKLADGQQVLGLTVGIECWPGCLEDIAASGYDFIWLDCEHSALTLPQVQALCHEARILNLPAILRPEAALFHLIVRYLDLGPSGILLPYVERMEQIEILEQATYLPPRGKRSPGGPCMAWLNVPNRQSIDEYERDCFRMIQVESIAGIEILPELLTADCLDAVMLGPNDLTVSLGCAFQRDEPIVVEAIEKVLGICSEHGMPCGMVCNSLQEARFWSDRGFRFMICGDIVRVATGSFKALHDSVRKFDRT